MTVLTTERLVLKRLSAADIPTVVELLNDYEVSKWLTIVPYPYSEADARRFLAFLDGGAPLDGFGLHGPDGLMGVVGIGESLGYWLGRRFHGQGYMTEAATALVDHYFRTTGEDHLTSGYFSGNAASKGVLTKLRFRHSHDERTRSRAQGCEVTLHKVVLRRDDWEARDGQ